MQGLRTPGMALCLLAIACGNRSEGDSDPPDETSVVEDTAPPPTFAVAVTPEDARVQTGPEGGESVTFEASVEWTDGSTDAPGPATWSLSDETVGTIDVDGVFVPSTDIGGRTDVVATIEGVEGRTTLVSRWVSVIGDDNVDPTWFDGGTTPWKGTAFDYPETGAVFPLNTPSLTFQWADVAARGYKLEFSTETINLTVYTPDHQWTATAEDWTRIIRSNAGSDVTARLWASFDGALWEAVPLVVSVDAFEAEGSVIYWSTSVSGMIEIPFGGAARDFFTGANAGACVGCHTISSRGLMAYNRGGGGGTLGLYDIAKGAEVVDAAQASADGLRTHYSTFSPDGSHLVAGFQGELQLMDGLTGAKLGTVASGSTVTQPDWSPDGSQLAFVRSTPCGSDIYLCKAGTNTIERMGWDGKGFGDAEVLYTAPAGEVAYYPVHSPDGAWIVFNRSTGDSYDDPDATLWTISADGSIGPIALEAANAVGSLTNSWPKFAPAADGAATFWVAFASRRVYDGRTQPQIWISAFDPMAAAAGLDPSSPALWLPGQNPVQNNHIPTWTEVPAKP